MARFLKHTACPLCGSSDALAHYEDGSTYCFSHGKSTKSASLSPYVTSFLGKDDDEEGVSKPVCLPSDAVQSYPIQAVAWAAKYEISVQELLSNKVYYSGARNQLIFTFLDGEGKLLAYQARNLSAESKARRYYTQGDVNSLLPIYHGPASNTRKLVLVEDCLSAIKVASLADAGRDSMPCLGSGISLLKLTRLRSLYDELTVFLDGDMYHHALRIAKQAQMLGFKTQVVYSEHDPKEHDRKSLTSLLT